MEVAREHPVRRAARVDANQSDVIEALRAIGASVQPLHMVGQGCPDLLVGHRDRNWLIEVKDGAKMPSRRRLTDDQVRWRDAWRGIVWVVTCPQDAVAIVMTEGT